MSLYNVLVSAYNTFVAIFPEPLQWLVTLLILLGLVTALVVLVRHHVLFLIVVIILLPFVVPVVVRFISDIYHFLIYLLSVLHLASPPPPS